MSAYTKLQKERKNRGVCVDCEGKIDDPAKFVRCPECRERNLEKIRAYRAELAAKQPTPNEIWARKKMRMDAEKALAAEKLRLKIEKCKRCEWGTIVGSKVYCPFMDGICMKKGKTKNDAERVSGTCERNAE